MGRHSRRKRGTEAPGPPHGVQWRQWTVRRKVFTVLGGISAVIVIASVVGATLGGGPGSAPGSGLGSGSGASTQNVPAYAASLPQLPVDAALTGSEAAAWADAALATLGAPTTSANVKTMVDWFANEGTPHDLNNPLNLQTPYGGSTVSTADGDPVSVGIQAYPTPADFVAAFPIEMNNGSYPAIVAALKAGTGLEGSAASREIAAELSVYSGGGYDSIPAAYNS
jgi:hypothetical protein